MLLYNVTLVLFRIAFAPDSSHASPLVFDYVGDALLWIDIALQFRLAFERDGALVTDKAQISARDRESGMLLYDGIARAPIDVVMIAIGMRPELRLGRILKICTVNIRSQQHAASRRNGALRGAHGVIFFFFFLFVFSFQTPSISCYKR